jgi:2-polyprenyl-3-methyl-5-hydroxy-6-metoxy-1,4-benzoquinol methylase
VSAVPTVRVERCPVCGGAGRTALHAGLRDRVFGVAPGTWDLHACTSCGSAFLDPRPADAAIGALYASYYTHAPPRPNLQPAGALGRRLRALRNGHIDARLGYRAQPASPLGAALGALPPARALFERAVRSLPAAGVVLDVGCGHGLWVAEIAALGWEARGIDLDERAVLAGRRAGLDLEVATLAQHAARNAGAYDAVTLSHVIEHLPDPRAALADVRALLRPGGRVWIATPNLEARGHRRFGPDWVHLDPPRHLVLFRGRSLRAMLEEAGLRDVEVRAAVPGAVRAARISHAVAGGVVPAQDARRAPLAVLARAAADELAGQADRRAAEELVITARA